MVVRVGLQSETWLRRAVGCKTRWGGFDHEHWILTNKHWFQAANNAALTIKKTALNKKELEM